VIKEEGMLIASIEQRLKMLLNKYPMLYKTASKAKELFCPKWQ
jgi:hypothetical protein